MGNDKDLYAVILAGGSGTRFWPLSRQARPKQFLKVVNNSSLLEQTINRIKPLVDQKNIFIVGNQGQKSLIKKSLKSFSLPSNNVLLEPIGKNTAASIAWASEVIHKKNPNAILFVLPSDHLIKNEKVFLDYLKQAIVMAKNGFLVTLGILPTRPETGYGYLKLTKAKGFNRVEFTEKPSLEKAKKFLKAKNYFWNSGMFVWQSKTILDEFRRFLPAINLKSIERNWKKLPSISIDYGILEKSKRVVCLPTKNMEWSDLGSWESLYDVLPKDTMGHHFRGNVLSIESKNCLILGDKRVVAAIGLENLIIVDTPDALLVCRKDASQQIRDLVARLEPNVK